MFICESCNYQNPILMVQITDAVKVLNLCPNCVAKYFLENKFSFINNQSWIDDVTGKPGAVRYSCGNEDYYLERHAMMRLVSHNLRKHEYLALAKKYGADKFMLHDDFYWEDGTAMQPLE